MFSHVSSEQHFGALGELAGTSRQGKFRVVEMRPPESGADKSREHANGQEGKETCRAAALVERRRASASGSFQKQVSDKRGRQVDEAHSRRIASEGIQPRPFPWSPAVKEAKGLRLRRDRIGFDFDPETFGCSVQSFVTGPPNRGNQGR